MPRPYRVPWSPVLPILGVLFAVYLMSDLPLSTWIRFVVWLALGLAIYFLYGYRHSKLRLARDAAAETAPEEQP
jgi:APA family basic amino acid/polyamine antiporter